MFSRKTSHIVILCQHSSFTTHHMVNVAPKRNKNSCKHEQEWGQAEQTCLHTEICSELSHDQALTHSCRLLRFLSTGGETTAKPLWSLYVELFSTSAHTGPAWGKGLQTCLTFGLFSERSSVIRSRKSVQAKHRDRQTCPDNTEHVITVWQQR